MSEHNYEKLRGQLRGMARRLARIEGHLGLAPMAEPSDVELRGREPVKETRPPRRPPGNSHTVQTRGGPVEVSVRKVSPGRPGKRVAAPAPTPAVSRTAAPAAPAPVAVPPAAAPGLLDMLGQLSGVIGALQEGLGIQPPAAPAAEQEGEAEAEDTAETEPQAADPSGENWMAAEGVGAGG